MVLVMWKWTAVWKKYKWTMAINEIFIELKQIEDGPPDKIRPWCELGVKTLQTWW